MDTSATIFDSDVRHLLISARKFINVGVDMHHPCNMRTIQVKGNLINCLPFHHIYNKYHHNIDFFTDSFQL